MKRWILSAGFAFIAIAYTQPLGAQLGRVDRCRSLGSGADGSFVLTGSIFVRAAERLRTCLELEQVPPAPFFPSHVTLDLAGFNIHTDSGAGVTAIRCNDLTGPISITIRNGSIEGFGVGIDCRGIHTGHLVENLDLTGNGAGVLVGDDSVVKNNIVQDGLAGISVGRGSIVSNNIASGNDEQGIIAERGSIVQDNVATSNGGGGIEVEGAGSIISGNVASDNEGIGLFVAGCPAHIFDNVAFGNKTDNRQTDIVVSGRGCTRRDNLPPP